MFPPVCLYVLLMILCIYGVFMMQTVAQEGQAQEWRAANRTAVTRLEARGTKTQRTTAVSVTSAARVCLTTRYDSHGLLLKTHLMQFAGNPWECLS